MPFQLCYKVSTNYLPYFTEKDNEARDITQVTSEAGIQTQAVSFQSPASCPTSPKFIWIRIHAIPPLFNTACVKQEE